MQQFKILMSNKGYVLITGASTGIGYATCKTLLDNGYSVFGSVRKQEDADKLSKELSGAFFPLIFDVSNQEQINQAKAIVEDKLQGSGLTALVNNAGMAVSGPLQFIPIEEVEKQLEVNVLGVLRVTQSFLPLLGGIENCPFPAGKIINISSVSGMFTNPFMGPYCMSKYALESMTDAFRRELSIYGIDVVGIQPGPIQTPIWEKAKEEGLRSDYSHTPYRNLLSIRDKIIEQNQSIALPVEKVSNKVLHLIETNRPPTKNVILKSKFLFKVLRLLPDRTLDKLMTKSLMKGKFLRK